MNFFEHQAVARRLSRRLVVLFAIAVLAIVIAVDTVVVILLAVHQQTDEYGSYQFGIAAHSGAIFWTTVIVVSVIGIASLHKTSALRAGGATVALAMGGERVHADTRDPLHKRLLNVVEEIAIASGVPVPDVFLLEHELGINAFAAGHTTANAAIAVTRGALENLSRDELQGVIAHEFSHILNGDMRLNTRLIGLLFGILVIALAGRFVLRFAPRGQKKGGAFAVIILAAVAVMAIGYIGLLFGRLIQAAVSRSRERLADASAVQFTRDPLGLRNALVKIGAIEAGSHLSDVDAEEVAHLLFAPGTARWFSTHPPLLARIRDLDPSFKAHEFDAARKVLLARQNASAESEQPAESTAGRLEQLLNATIPITSVSQLVANPGAEQLAMAHAIRESLPEEIIAAASSTMHATGLFLALALDENVEAQDRQIKFISTQLGSEIASAVRHWLTPTRSLKIMQRQPALLRLLPALRQLSRAERLRLLTCLNGLLQREGMPAVNQYALRKLAQVHLLESLEVPALPGNASLRSYDAELSLLFAVLAHSGNDNNAVQARQAYEAGMHLLLPRARPEYVPPRNWAAPLDLALTKLDRLMPAAKELLVQALLNTIAHDQQLTSSEAELLRAICASLHCPLPPLLHQ